MKKILILLFILTAALFISCKKNKDLLTAKEVQAVIKQFDKGWKNKDTALVNASLAKSYIYFTQSGGTFDRQNVLHTAGSAEYKLEECSREEISYRLEGNTAIVNSIWIGKGWYRGVPFADTQRCSITIIKTNGKVQILSEHCTIIK